MKLHTCGSLSPGLVTFCDQPHYHQVMAHIPWLGGGSLGRRTHLQSTPGRKRAPYSVVLGNCPKMGVMSSKGWSDRAHCPYWSGEVGSLYRDCRRNRQGPVLCYAVPGRPRLTGLHHGLQGQPKSWHTGTMRRPSG
jgi:hypothetical protein